MSRWPSATAARGEPVNVPVIGQIGLMTAAEATVHVTLAAPRARFYLHTSIGLDAAGAPYAFADCLEVSRLEIGDWLARLVRANKARQAHRLAELLVNVRRSTETGNLFFGGSLP